MQCWSYGVVVAHRTLNPVTRVQSSVGPSFFPKLGNKSVIAAIIFCEIESDLIHLAQLKEPLLNTTNILVENFTPPKNASFIDLQTLCLKSFTGCV